MNTASLHTEPLKGKSFTLDDFQAIFGTPDGSRARTRLGDDTSDDGDDPDQEFIAEEVEERDN